MDTDEYALDYSLYCCLEIMTKVYKCWRNFYLIFEMKAMTFKFFKYSVLYFTLISIVMECLVIKIKKKFIFLYS